MCRIKTRSPMINNKQKSTGKLQKLKKYTLFRKVASGFRIVIFFDVVYDCISVTLIWNGGPGIEMLQTFQNINFGLNLSGWKSFISKPRVRPELLNRECTPVLPNKCFLMIWSWVRRCLDSRFNPVPLSFFFKEKSNLFKREIAHAHLLLILCST